MDQRLKHDTIKLLEKKHGKKLIDIGLGNNLGHMMPKAQATKEKNQQMGLYQTQIFCMQKNQWNEKTAYRMGEIFCKPYIM